MIKCPRELGRRWGEKKWAQRGEAGNRRHTLLRADPYVHPRVTVPRPSLGGDLQNPAAAPLRRNALCGRLKQVLVDGEGLLIFFFLD